MRIIFFQIQNEFNRFNIHRRWMCIVHWLLKTPKGNVTNVSSRVCAAALKFEAMVWSDTLIVLSTEVPEIEQLCLWCEVRETNVCRASKSIIIDPSYMLNRTLLNYAGDLILWLFNSRFILYCKEFNSDLDEVKKNIFSFSKKQIIFIPY